MKSGKTIPRMIAKVNSPSPQNLGSTKQCCTLGPHRSETRASLAIFTYSQKHHSAQQFPQILLQSVTKSFMTQSSELSNSPPKQKCHCRSGMIISGSLARMPRSKQTQPHDMDLHNPMIASALKLQTYPWYALPDPQSIGLHIRSLVEV